MKKLIVLLIIFFQSFLVVFSRSNSPLDDAGLKEYVSKNRKYKFRVKYPTRGWYFARDIKQQRNSRFKDIIVLMGYNRINQIRVSTYNGLSAPNAKKVGNMLEAEFVRQEIKPGEQYVKVRDVPMPKRLIKAANAKEGWLLAFTYGDRREGNFYSTYYIFYRKVVLPSNKPGKPPLIIGKAYVIRSFIRERDFSRLIKDVLKLVKTFKYILS